MISFVSHDSNAEMKSDRRLANYETIFEIDWTHYTIQFHINLHASGYFRVLKPGRDIDERSNWKTSQARECEFYHMIN